MVTLREFTACQETTHVMEASDQLYIVQRQVEDRHDSATELSPESKLNAKYSIIRDEIHNSKSVSHRSTVRQENGKYFKKLPRNENNIFIDKNNYANVEIHNGVKKENKDLRENVFRLDDIGVMDEDNFITTDDMEMIALTWDTENTFMFSWTNMLRIMKTSRSGDGPYILYVIITIARLRVNVIAITIITIYVVVFSVSYFIL